MQHNQSQSNRIILECKKLLILLLLSNCLFSLPNAVADEEKICIEYTDEGYHYDTLDAIGALGDLQKEFEQSVPYGKKQDDIYKIRIFRKYAIRQKQIIKKIENNHSHIKNAHIKKLNRIVLERVYETAEIIQVIAALFEARETNNIDALTALAASLVTKEAQHLAMPVLTRIALEYRIKKAFERSQFIYERYQKQGTEKLIFIRDEIIFCGLKF